MEQKFIGCEESFEEGDIILFGVPFDATSTYRRGSALAPRKIREESFGIETYSPYQDKDLEDILVCDIGDVEVGGNKDNLKSIEQMLYSVGVMTKRVLDAGKFPIMLGGEHLVSLGAFREVFAKYPDVCIVHFDAHTDLRENWEGNPYNHSTVVRRCFDLVGGSSKQPRIFQFGIRSGERVEFEFSKQNCYLVKSSFSDGEKSLEKALKIIGKGPVYFTIDLDVLDPSEFGGTGTPEAGGVRFLELLDACKKVFGKTRVVGCDINELSPPFDSDGKSTALACKLLREILLLI